MLDTENIEYYLDSADRFLAAFDAKSKRMFFLIGSTISIVLYLCNCFHSTASVNVYVASNVPNSAQAILKQRMASVANGKIVEQLTEACTHMATPTSFSLVNFSEVHVNLILAMLYGVAIVSTDFFGHGNDGERNVADFVPTITMMDIGQIIPKTLLGIYRERQTLFKGKTFLFMDETQKDLFTQFIKLAGGRSAVKTEPSVLHLIRDYVPVEGRNCSKPNEINVKEYIEANGRRLIGQHEILHAILGCIASKFCNPDYLHSQ